MSEDNLAAIMSNVYEAMDIISREPIGMVGSVTVSASSQRVALNQNIAVDIEPEIVGVSVVPAMTPPEPADLTPEVENIVITKAEAFPFKITGDSQKIYDTSSGWISARTNRILQAMRTASNAVEADLAALHTQFGRAYGTPGTTPFSSTTADSAQLGKILTDNGAPANERKLVIDTTAGVNLRSLASLTKANEAGTTDTLRLGSLLDLNGFRISESGKINTSVAGTGASYQTTAAFAVGDTSITLDTGTGTILAGDCIQFAGDSNIYVVHTALTAGTVIIAKNGLRESLSDNTAVTVIAAAARNMAFNRSAIVLAARPISMPDDGDAATEVEMIVDPVSGLPFEIAHYKGYRMNRWELNLAWGAKVIKREHTALLLG